MPDLGIGLLLPTESVAVRAALGSMVAVVLMSLLLRRGLRVAMVRSVAVLVPTAALLVAVALSWGSLGLPRLMTATSDGSFALQVGGTFVQLNSIWWLLIALWGAVAVARISRRVWVLHRATRIAARATPVASARVRKAIHRLSRRLQVPVPRAVLADACPGGGTVVGIRQPTLVLDAQLVRTLDAAELEGLVAHELAHVKRRDNLVALLVGLARDVTFFLPGGRWVVRRLCEERELAADQLVVGLTNRPGALASGLLKAVSARRARAALACGSAFSHRNYVAVRVERLISDAAPATRARAALESALVAAVLTAAVAAAIGLPAAVADTPRQPLGLGIIWARPATPALPASAEAIAVTAYRRSTPPTPASADEVSPLAADDIRDFHSYVIRGAEPPPSSTLRAVPGWQARPVIAFDEELAFEPLVAADEGVGFYVLRRVGVTP